MKCIFNMIRKSQQNVLKIFLAQFWLTLLFTVQADHIVAITHRYLLVSYSVVLICLVNMQLDTEYRQLFILLYIVFYTILSRVTSLLNNQLFSFIYVTCHLVVFQSSLKTVVVPYQSCQCVHLQKPAECNNFSGYTWLKIRLNVR